MFNDFQLAAIAKTQGGYQLLQIPLGQNIQTEFRATWYQQYLEFTNEIEEIPFDPGFQPEGEQRFVLTDYDLPAWFDDVQRNSVDELDLISVHEQQIDNIKGLVAFVQKEDDSEMLLFQNFSRAHVIRPGRFLFLDRDLYKSAENPGLALQGKLSAIYEPLQSKLLFQHFRTTNTFLPLTDQYEEASEESIREILAHERLLPENVDALALNASQWFRKRFALLRDSEILDDYTAAEIAHHAGAYGVNIEVEDDKVVFPADKHTAKRVLQFLNEELYKGAITNRLYETNSKREAQD